MNSDNITYIFGAGASCKSQPLVIDMKERMVCLLDLLNVECDLHQNHIHSDFKDKTNDLYIKYKPIVEEAIKHYTPDTYAKKLYLKSNSEIEIFKEFLDLYFLFEQDTEKVVYNTFPDDPYPHSPINLDDIVAFPIQKRENVAPKPKISKRHEFYNAGQWGKIKSYTDYRYDVFFATLLSEDKEIDPLYKTLYLPKEHNIISWNYDNQLEIAYKEYNNRSETGTIHDKLYINKPYSDIRSHVYKVNGFCSMYNSANDVELSFKTQLDLLIKGSDVPQSSIYFAWDTTKPNYFGGINKIMERTNILVVIGYSFPNFNRDIDCDILDKLTILTCKEIVIQVPTKYEFKKIKDRIKQLNPYISAANFRFEDNPDQFYIP